MLYKFFLSKKGFTLTEIMIVFTILSILTAVAVPIMGTLLHKQKINDCKNQREAISAVVIQTTSGMIDNGKKQPAILFNNLQSDHYTAYPGDGVNGNMDDAYVGQPCFILWSEKVDTVKDSADVPHTINQLPVSIGDIRGKHRDEIQSTWTQYPNYGRTAYSYNDGCAYDAEYAAKHQEEKTPRTNPAATCFLKKKALKNTPLYNFMDNYEVPVCPFVDDYTSKDEPEYFYYIFADATVLCSCPDCNEAD